MDTTITCHIFPSWGLGETCMVGAEAIVGTAVCVKERTVVVMVAIMKVSDFFPFSLFLTELLSELLVKYGTILVAVVHSRSNVILSRLLYICR